MSLLKIIAIVLLVLSVVLAVMGGSFLNPMYLAVLSFVVLSVLAGVIT